MGDVDLFQTQASGFPSFAVAGGAVAIDQRTMAGQGWRPTLRQQPWLEAHTQRRDQDQAPNPHGNSLLSKARQVKDHEHRNPMLLNELQTSKRMEARVKQRVDKGGYLDSA